MRRSSILARLALATTAVLVPSVALAHTGVGDTSGFVQGFTHPVGGLDHILAMVAVGLFAANLGGRALWAVPLAFVGLMAVGGILGMNGVAIPYLEAGIALSVLVLGLAVALKRPWPLAAAMGLVGFFALFHGAAHGAEMAAGVSGLTYALGFVVATALLHGLGIAIGLAIGRIGSVASLRLTQAGGAALAVVGAGLLAGVV